MTTILHTYSEHGACLVKAEQGGEENIGGIAGLAKALELLRRIDVE